MDSLTQNDDIIDAELVAAVKEDPEKYRLLFNKYYWHVWGYIRQRLDTDSRTREEDTKDLTMITFEYALSSINKHDEVRSFKALIYSLAQRMLNNHKLNKKWMYQIVDDKTENDTNSIVIFNSMTPEQQCIDDEFKCYINSLISRMPDMYVEIAYMYYVENLGYKEIASIVHLPESTISGRLVFIKQYLAKKISPNRTVVKRRIPISFTEKEITFIKNNFHLLKNEELLKELEKMMGVPMHLVTMQKYCSNVLNLRHSNSDGTNRMHNFNEKEIEYIKTNYHKKTCAQLTEDINISRVTPVPYYAVQWLINKTLNLIKTK